MKTKEPKNGKSLISTTVRIMPELLAELHEIAKSESSPIQPVSVNAVMVRALSESVARRKADKSEVTK